MRVRVPVAVVETYLGLRETIRPMPDDYVSLRYGWFGTVTGRLGLTYDRILGYVKGGMAVASITNTAPPRNPGLFLSLIHRSLWRRVYGNLQRTLS
jgi:hypothetical protein